MSAKLDGIGTVLVVGAGNMGSALVAAWLAEGLSPAKVTLLDPAPGEKAKELRERHELELAPGADALSGRSFDVVLLAVKPQVMADAAKAAGPLVAKDGLVLSIAAGLSLATLAAMLGQDKPVVRAMPNTPAAIGHGATVLVAGAHATEGQKAAAGALLGAAGEVFWIEDEDLMDAVTALSGSGPAYVFHLAEAMTAAGEKLGLSQELSAALARATVAGAGAMLDAAPENAAELRQAVTSPGGTTEAALSVLTRDQGLKALMIEAMTAARERARALSDTS